MEKFFPCFFLLFWPISAICVRSRSIWKNLEDNNYHFFLLRWGTKYLKIYVHRAAQLEHSGQTMPTNLTFPTSTHTNKYSLTHTTYFLAANINYPTNRNNWRQGPLRSKEDDPRLEVRYPVSWIPWLFNISEVNDRYIR
jgi:hypothetical protein